MKLFKDNEDRQWHVDITVATVKRVRGLLEVNLLDVVEGNLLDRLLADPVLLCDVLYAVCKPQADAAGVTDEQFGEGLAGDAIEQATKALLEALTDFSPGAKTRANLQRLVEASEYAREKAQDLIQEKFESGKVRAEIDRVLEIASASSGKPPASSVSTPDP